MISNYSVAFSVNVDGIHTGDEWDNATVNKLFDGESNCSVNLGLVKTLIDNENSAIFLCFMHRDPSLEVDNVNTGVSVSVENSEYVSITPASSPQYVDYSECSFEGFVTVDENNGATTEVRIGFKFGLPKEIKCKVRFVDSDGAMSNVYGFTVINDEYSETTELIITQREPEKETTSKREKTTKEPKETTRKTVKKTEKKTTVKATEKTTGKIKSSRRYTYVRTTKPKMTKASATVKTIVEKVPATVYYEKEVIISHIYVTQTDVSSTANNTTETAMLTNAIHTHLITSAEPETKIKSSFSLSEGAKKKAIIGIFAAVAFTIIAAAGTRSSKKSSDNDDNPDSR